MMVEDLLKRLRREFIKVNLMQAALDAIAAFLATNLVLFLFSIQLMGGVSNPVAVGAASVIFFIADLGYRSRKYRLEIYEEHNPELQEILRTARDNMDRDDTVSWAMFADLLRRAQSVSADTIIPSRAIMQKIVVIGGLSILTMLSGVTDLHFQREGGQIIPAVPLGDTGEDGANDTFQLKDADTIYGDAADISAADMQMEFNITGSGATRDGVDARDGVPPDQLVLDTMGQTLQEDVALAKRYSLAIRNLTG